MRQQTAEAIILSRTDYGEADRILTVLTPQYGKLRIMARGVRKVKSKLAGGIELFSVSEITFIKGRGEIDTLVSTRLAKHYRHIVEDLERTMAAYEFIKQLNRITEDEAEAEYFTLLQQMFEALDDHTILLPLVTIWFTAQLLSQGGFTPNLVTDTNGEKLQPGEGYDFSFESVCFDASSGQGRFTAGHIKLLRLLFAGHQPKTLAGVQGGMELLPAILPLVTTMRQTYLQV
jgi:DNA repair protein RecO (recombination protein O)